MDAYDPLRAPDPEEWLALSEDERIGLVAEYHDDLAAEDESSAQIHAAVHATVETQVALGDELPVASVLERLMDEGLDRHESLHAIGMVLAELFFDTMRDPKEHDDPQREYLRALDRLTAEKWRASGEA